MKRCLPFFVFTFLFFPPYTAVSQMPDWNFFKDREGNKYYYDRAFKIRVTDTSEKDYTPVTSTGIDFFLHKGIELINEKKYPEGLFYLKSIRALKSENSRVRKARVDAAKWIDFLYKKHGTRYELYDKESSVIIKYENDIYHLINSKLFYRVTLLHRPFLLKKEWKYYDKGYGLKFGVKVERDGDYEGFNYITGIESRIFPGTAPSPDEALKGWMLELGIDNLERKEIFRGPDRVIYEIRYPGDAPFSGLEGVFVSENRSHLARVFYHNSVSGRVSERAKLMLQNLVLVR